MNENFKDKAIYVYNPVTGKTDLVKISDLVKSFKLENMLFNLNNKENDRNKIS